MIKRLLLIAATGLLLSGCFIAPVAFIGPATSGFSTASIIQSSVTTSANYMVKKSTGRTIGEHVYEVIQKDIHKHTYLPNNFTKNKNILPRSRPTK
tara:strand:- start:506 stop:793 length:288 start_codon:yes stop_codon:yes gene_type:complete